jgi:hypothetical protein
MPTATATPRLNRGAKRTRKTLKLPSQPQPETPPPASAGPPGQAGGGSSCWNDGWNKPAPAEAGGDILNDPLPDDAPAASPQPPRSGPLPLYDTIHAKALIDPGFAIAWALLEVNDAMHDIAAEVRALADQQRRHWDDGK